MKTILMSLVTVLSVSALANEKHPCGEVKKACESAGFVKGKHKEGKGLWMDCIDKLAKGESVPGVTVSADVVKACKEKHEERKTK